MSCLGNYLWLSTWNIKHGTFVLYVNALPEVLTNQYLATCVLIDMIQTYP